MAVEIIAGTPPGGGQDRAARALAGLLGVETTVSNIPGRGGGNAWDRLVLQRGATDLAAVSSPTLITNAIVGESIIDYRDLTPLALVYTEYSALVVRPGSGLEEPSALLDAIGEGTSVVSFATAPGSMNHLALAEVASHLGTPVTTVPIRVFESAPQALADLVAGNGDVAVVSAVSATAGLGDGTLTAVLVTASQRLGGVFAKTATCVELGVPCVRGTWRGLVGPPGLDRSTIDAWDDSLGATIAGAAWMRLLEDNLWTGTYLGSDETWHFLEAEREKLGNLLGQIGLVATVGDG